MNRISLIKYMLLAAVMAGMMVIGISIVRRRFGKFFFLSLAVVLGISGLAGYSLGVEPYWIRIHKVEVRDAALAPVVEGLTLVHITDVHITQGLGFREKQLIRKVNALKPDIIFFTGDLMDSRAQIPAAIELLKSFRPSIGMFGLPGDTDKIVMNEEEFARTFSPAGLEVLLNESRNVPLPDGRTLWLVGAGASKTNSRNPPVVPPGAPLIVLTHSPDIFDQAVKDGINLVLAGDTHGGQVGIPFLVRLSRYANRGPYMKGMFHEGKTHMYVNNGIGTKSLPLRFLCPPEIAVIKVKP